MTTMAHVNGHIAGDMGHVTEPGPCQAACELYFLFTLSTQRPESIHCCGMELSLKTIATFTTHGWSGSYLGTSGEGA